MEKEKLDKILSLLKEGGVDEELIKKVEGELSEAAPEDDTLSDTPSDNDDAPADSDVPAEGEDNPSNDDGEPSSDDTAKPEDANPVDGETSDVPPADDVPPAEDTPADVPPADQPSDLPPGVVEVDPTADVPADVPADPVPPVDGHNEEVTELKAQLEEQKAANEGLKARIDGLEEALKKAGIMEDTPSTAPVGVDDGTRTPDFHDDDADFDAVLNEINRGY